VRLSARQRASSAKRSLLRVARRSAIEQ
jgi:hypothetical protein